MKRLILPAILLALSTGSPGYFANARADAHIYELDNGMTIRLVPADLNGEVFVLLGVKAGFFAEPPGKPHLAHIAEHMVFHDIDANLIPTVAAWREENRANAETLADLMYFDIRAGAEELESAIAVQASRMKITRFHEATLQREVPLALGELDTVETGVIGATGKFALTAFVQSALHGKTAEPIRERTRQITLEDVQAFHAAQFRPQRAMLTVVGDFEPQQAMRLIARHFGRIPHQKDSDFSRPPLRPGRHAATWDVNRKHVFVGFAMPPLRDDDHASMTALSYLMQQRMASEPLTRGARLSATLGPGQIDGIWLVSLALPDDADEAAVIEKLKQQFEAIAGPRPPSPGELRAVIALIKQMALRLNEPQPVPPGIDPAVVKGNQELQNMFMTLAYGDPRAYVRRIESVTDTKAADTAARRLKWDTASVVVVSPRR